MTITTGKISLERARRLRRITMATTMFAAQTSNANSAARALTGGMRTVVAWGTWGGGTVTLQMSPDETTWIDVPDGALTANGAINIYAGPELHYRVALTGATAPELSVKVF
jgi:hypothetical protein